jgi:murein DD-endopeptidase MepM/ murein hydrolase activator NlpD
VRTPRAFYAAAEPAGLTYVLHSAAPAPVAIDLVRLADGVVVEHWDAPAVAPEGPQVVTWDGTSGGVLQPAGRYAFRATVGSVAGAAQVEPPGQAAFAFATDRFPIVGPHRFGTGAAAFGGARHHQGQDTFAACGTPLVAAHGGVVKYGGWQSAAGNYLVIDNAGSGTDYVYMHLRAPALVSKGDPVLTGQPIGFVGDTGDADGCHLHFEIWTAPGWYTGGHPIDPLPFLEAWDR